ncbi:MAG: FtsW/RodA/SpoVE family cell cycle protein, partial [Candidatus Omnitrophica bacterium]|nr:FtsW/RodA/SpoVE family cell cycle protein [Candidatus Omnitrophota bacterium]
MRQIRINILITAFILMCIGVVMIYSASSIYALERYKDTFYFLKRHLAFLGIGLLCMFLAMFFDYRLLQKYSKPLLVIALILLALVLIPGIGREVSGARRWFRFKIISFQPSEFANLAMIVYVSDFIIRKGEVIRNSIKGFFPVMCVLGTFAVFILLQPDLGTTVAMSFVVFVMLFVGGVRISYFVSIILAAVPMFYVLVF